MRQITNSYSDCQLVVLDEAPGANGPFAVTQTGFNPNDPSMKELPHFLRDDGKWVDEIAFGTSPLEERFRVVFPTAGDAMKLLASLPSHPEFVSRETTEAEIAEFIARLKSMGSVRARLTVFVAEWRQSRSGASA
jgi:hypothetical protein